MIRKFLAAAGVAGCLSLAGFGIASATTVSIPDGSGVIHTCYTPVGGGPTDLQVIDSGTLHGVCGAHQTELDFNQAGVQGPAGPAGPQGPQGPAGSSDSFYEVSNQANVQATALCNTGDTAIGGGYQVASGVSVSESMNSADLGQAQGWTARANGGNNSITVYAECVSG